MHLVDVHCHLNHALFKDDLPAVLRRAEKAGVKAILTSGVNPPANVPSSSSTRKKLRPSEILSWTFIGRRKKTQENSRLKTSGRSSALPRSSRSPSSSIPAKQNSSASISLKKSCRATKFPSICI